MADKKISALTAATTPLVGTEVLPIVQSGSTVKVAVSDLTAGRAISATSATLSNLTSGRVTYATTSGLLTDSANLTYNGTILNVGGTAVSGSTTGIEIGAAATVALRMGQDTTHNALVFWSYNATPANAAMYVETYGSNNTLILQSGGGGKGVQIGVPTGGDKGSGTLNVASDIHTQSNVVIGTSGKGIDFSATPGTGTSELFADYEEGTWTPALTSAGGNFTTIAYGDQQGFYTKVGRQVTVYGFLFTSGAITAGSASGQVYVSGLPFAVVTAGIGTVWTNPDTANYNSPLALATGVTASSSTLRLFKAGLVNNTAFAVTDLRTAGGPSNYIFFQSTYFV